MKLFMKLELLSTRQLRDVKGGGVISNFIRNLNRLRQAKREQQLI